MYYNFYFLMFLSYKKIKIKNKYVENSFCKSIVMNYLIMDNISDQIAKLIVGRGNVFAYIFQYTHLSLLKLNSFLSVTRSKIKREKRYSNYKDN